MPGPFAAFMPALAKGLGEALPFLTLSLLGKKKNKPPLLSQEESELMQLRAQLANQNLHRQAMLDQNFKALAQGLFGVLPEYARRGITPPQFPSGTKPIVPPIAPIRKSGGGR